MEYLKRVAMLSDSSVRLLDSELLSLNIGLVK